MQLPKNIKPFWLLQPVIYQQNLYIKIYASNANLRIFDKQDVFSLQTPSLPPISFMRECLDTPHWTFSWEKCFLFFNEALLHWCYWCKNVKEYPEANVETT